MRGMIVNRLQWGSRISFVRRWNVFRSIASDCASVLTRASTVFGILTLTFLFLYSYLHLVLLSMFLLSSSCCHTIGISCVFGSHR